MSSNISLVFEQIVLNDFIQSINSSPQTVV